LDPLSNTIVDLNKPKIIGNGGELVGVFTYQNRKSKMSPEHGNAHLFCLGSLINTIADLNKLKIIRNGKELSDLEYLPTKTENVEYLQNTGMRTYRLFRPL